jgi:hypothetical protein
VNPRQWFVFVVMSYSADMAVAHHSLAGYLGPSDPEGLVRLEGRVLQFRFTNPHGIVLLEVRATSGVEERWTIETLAPAMLSKTGWSAHSIKPGERIRIEGWRARDGSRLARLQSVTRADGTVLGMQAADSAK